MQLFRLRCPVCKNFVLLQKSGRLYCNVLYLMMKKDSQTAALLLLFRLTGAGEDLPERRGRRRGFDRYVPDNRQTVTLFPAAAS